MVCRGAGHHSSEWGSDPVLLPRKTKTTVDSPVLDKSPVPGGTVFVSAGVPPLVLRPSVLAPLQVVPLPQALLPPASLLASRPLLWASRGPLSLGRRFRLSP